MNILEKHKKVGQIDEYKDIIREKEQQVLNLEWELFKTKEVNIDILSGNSFQEGRNFCLFIFIENNEQVEELEHTINNLQAEIAILGEKNKELEINNNQLSAEVKRHEKLEK